MNKRYIKDRDLSLNDLNQRIKDSFQLVIKYWYLLLITIAIFLGLFLYVHFSTPVTYIAKVEFFIEGEGSAPSGLSLLARQFGLGSPVSGKTNPYKVIAVAKSINLARQLVTHKEVDTLIGNKIINIYGLQKRWAKTQNGLDLYQFTDTISFDHHLDGKALKFIKEVLWGNESNSMDPLLKISFDDDSRSFLIRSETISESLSISLVNKLYDNLSYFFEYEMLQNQLKAKGALKVKLDSLSAVMSKKYYELASFEDSNLGSINSRSRVEREVLTQEISIINLAYNETSKNLEIADISLKNIQPLFLKTEWPISPIAPKKSNLIKLIFVAIILGSFLAILFILSIKVYHDALYAQF